MIRIIWWILLVLLMFGALLALYRQEYADHFWLLWASFIVFTWARGKRMKRILMHLTLGVICISSVISFYSEDLSKLSFAALAGAFTGVLLNGAIWAIYCMILKQRDAEEKKQKVASKEEASGSIPLPKRVSHYTSTIE